MTYHWMIPLIAAVASLVLASVVGRLGPKTVLSQVFTFLAIALVFWNLNFVVQYAVSDRTLAFEIVRVLRVGSMFVPPAIFHLSVAIRDRSSSIWTAVLLADYGVAIVLVVLNLFDLIVSDLRAFTWGYYSVGAPLYHLYTIFVLVNFVAAGGLMARDYRTCTDPRTLLQLKFWLLGLVIALPLGLTNLLPAYGVAIYPLGNLGSAAWVAIVAYAIVRHRLMDIEVVVSKSIAYFGVIVLLIGPAFLLGVFMQRLAFGEVDYDFSAGLLVLLLATGILFPAVQSRAEARVERSLFPQRQVSRTILSSFARSIIRILDRERLVRQFCDTLYEVFNLDRICLFLLADNSGKFQLQRAIGPDPTPALFGTDHVFVRWLTHQRDCVLRDELEHGRGRRDLKPIVELCRTNGWEVVAPLVTGSTLVGMVGIGQRRDLQAFTTGDLDLLGGVVAQASVAFENARLYEELRRSRDIINRAGRLSALGTLAAGIAHEIRNPLVSIQTFFQLAPQRLDDEEFMTSFLALAETEVQRISSLISELLTFAKSPASTVSKSDLGDIIDRAMTLLAPQARKQHVELVRIASEHLPPVLADPDQILQVLINIVLNGLQATPNGGKVTVLTRVIDYESGSYCQVEIRDTGAGIPEEIREAIFNPFFTTKDKGTGLGLPIAHRIIAESGGFITVESVEGEGSRFFVNLPLAAELEMESSVDEAAIQG
jgi:signal transduction histidine kinase